MTSLPATSPTASRYVARASERALPVRLRPVRLGAHLTDTGADFAVLAPHATAVDLCLIDRSASGITERRYSLHRDASFTTWVGHVSGVRAGQEYGYRVHGPWNPDTGMRFNPAQFLLDPYARAITGTPRLGPELYGHKVNDALDPVPLPPQRDDTDSLEAMCRGVVTAPTETHIRHPYTPWSHTVIYETHVRGLTQQLAALPEELRGTYAGLAHPIVTNYLRSLGVTAVELLPIHAKMSEPFLTERDLTNYWGYSTLSYFAPEPSLATATARAAGPLAVLQEVRDMVARLHDAGLEVILDVVYNHTCEGGVNGPTVSLRGFGQTTYYMQVPNQPGQFYDTTGTGNSLDFRRTPVLQLTLDSLRYWVSEIGVDGFRFDLAATLARRGDHFDTNHPLYLAMATDPILSNVKLINEPWDLGPNGWQTGNFLPPTADWNDRYRDSIRQFWVADQRAVAGGGLGGDLRDVATRLAGSADLFGHGRSPSGRGPLASVNFITAHDGFSLYDLVSYDSKHNEANGENGRDGTDNNRSWNHGMEGEGSDTAPLPEHVLRARTRTMRNLIGTLVFSAGVPMLYGGDEFADTKFGNNNAYCQDNHVSWLDWDHEEWQRELQATVAYLFRLRSEHRVLRPSMFYTESPSGRDHIPDLQWFADTGEPMPEHRWFDPSNRLLQMLRSGSERDADALVVINGSNHHVPIRFPQGRGNPFALAWDSSWPTPRSSERIYQPGASTRVEPLTMQLYFANPER
ncbi:glycogen debranching protein GlgX [Actinotignum timonense]|uniref:glycogen debranching protein GlgX n=1 Tax=Actinotignum TaxID=1653174 RepID=UPI00254E4D04|nr:glycogen debranching protein GlgX [Actinotignum timonense]MDK6907369.1 glycogen debranching protein GlgX [Actinotignum timonense]MDK8782275.1 glycogen debranching protein GlgX [Actinotignum timonense]